MNKLGQNTSWKNRYEALLEVTSGQANETEIINQLRADLRDAREAAAHYEE